MLKRKSKVYASHGSQWRELLQQQHQALHTLLSAEHGREHKPATEPWGAAVEGADLPRHLSSEKHLEKDKDVLPAENSLFSSQNETQQLQDNAPSGASGLSQPQTQRSG